MEKMTFTTAEIDGTLQEILNSGGVVPLAVTGGSMTPFLKHKRDTVFLSRCDFSSLKRGQILLFKREDGRLILHRIRKVFPERELLMNGDSQAWCEKINYSQVIAVVSQTERNGKNFSSDSFMFKIWNFLWFPTRPIRPFIFKMAEKIVNIKR